MHKEKKLAIMGLILMAYISKSSMSIAAGKDFIEPLMVRIPAGSFKMGCSCKAGGKPGKQRTVSIESFEIGKYEVTFAEWDTCVDDGGCGHIPDKGFLKWGLSRHPVYDVSYDDIVYQYIPWLNKKTGKTYRLPTEAEWEYAARAGTTTRYNTGDCITTDDANFNGSEYRVNYYGSDCKVSGCEGKGVNRGKTIPVGTLSANAFGLYDMHGNVSEWVQDCADENYGGVPTDGSASVDCKSRIVRGGSWSLSDLGMLLCNHDAYSHDLKGNMGTLYRKTIGFRLAK